MSPHRSNPFIAIEALDGAGKTTQTELLIDRLEREGYTPHKYHFPQEDKPTGRLIYEKYLHDAGRHPLSKREQALLYIQDFYAKLEEMRAITEQQGKHVLLSDRYCTSTMAYQSAGLSGQRRQAILDWMRWLCWEETPRLLKPDLVLLLDIPVAESLKRMEGKTRDAHEVEEKLKQFRRSYRRLAREEEWQIIDNMDETKRQRSKEDIHEEVWEHIRRVLT